MWPGARFSKVPKIFGCISGDNSLCIFKAKASRGTKLSHFNFPFFKRNEKNSFPESTDRRFTIGYSGPKSPWDFRGTGHRGPPLESPDTFRLT